MEDLEASLDRWRRTRDAFRWEIPDPFNFTRDVVGRFAAEPARPALLWRSAAGAEARLSFAEVNTGARRMARLLVDLGVAPGEPVIVMLPRIPAWQLAILGALEAAALVIPSSTILRPKDVAYRARHSRAAVIVATPESAAAIDAVRAEIPSVRHFLSWAEEGETVPAGWMDLRAALARTPGLDGPADARPPC